MKGKVSQTAWLQSDLRILTDRAKTQGPKSDPGRHYLGGIGVEKSEFRKRAGTRDD